MKKNLLIFIILIFFNKSLLFAEVFNKIDISGNKRVSKETIQVYGKLQLNKNYSNQDIDQILKNLYETGFFEEVTISSQNSTLKIVVKEYPTINQMIILGVKSTKQTDQIKKLMLSKENGSFIESNLEKDLDTMKKLFSSIGYNFAKIDTKIKKIDELNLDLIFEIDQGEISKISSINFIGDKKIRSNRLKSVVASEEDKFWKVISKNTKFSENLVNLDIRLLNNYYKSIGYRDVKVTSNSATFKEKGDVDLVYSIDAGKRYIINKISTNLDKVFDANLFFPLEKIYKKNIGEYYSPFKIKKMLESLDELIQKNNLQFVNHNVQEVIENDGISIIFNIFEDEKLLVERIDILGNNITNEDVIRGELILDEGDPYSELSVEKSIAKLRSRNIFKKVSYEVLPGTKQNLKKINISVEEKATGEISAGAGVGSNGGTVAFNIKENNWLGEGKIVQFNIELDEEQLKGTIAYKNPNYDFLGNSLQYSISSESNDKPDQGYENSILSAGISTSFEQYKDLRATLGVSASYDDLRTDSTASDSLKKQSGSFTEVIGTYGFSYDKRNRAFMPTDGSIVGFEQALPLIVEEPYFSNTLFASKYKSFSEDIIFANKLLFSNVNSLGSDDVRLSKRKSLSSKKLRGFEKNKIGPVDNGDYIGGNYATAINFEANLPNLLPEKTNTDISLFLDFGNVWGVDYDSSIDDSNVIRSSTGLAASWLSPIGPMTFTLSQNLKKATTDKTESFNFNLGTTF
mgnify:CR=1 FL=1